MVPRGTTLIIQSISFALFVMMLNFFKLISSLYAISSIYRFFIPYIFFITYSIILFGPSILLVLDIQSIGSGSGVYSSWLCAIPLAALGFRWSSHFLIQGFVDITFLDGPCCIIFCLFSFCLFSC